MSVVNIAFYILAIVGFVLGIIAVTKQPDKYLEQHYKTKPLNITVQNAVNAVNAQHCGDADSLGGVDYTQFCQCPITLDQTSTASPTPQKYFTIKQPQWRGRSPTVPEGGGLAPMLKFDSFSSNWQAFPDTSGAGWSGFNPPNCPAGEKRACAPTSARNNKVPTS